MEKPLKLHCTQYTFRKHNKDQLFFVCIWVVTVLLPVGNWEKIRFEVPISFKPYSLKTYSKYWTGFRARDVLLVGDCFFLNKVTRIMHSEVPTYGSKYRT